MKIAYLPLDSRPCNLRFATQLLQSAGVDCQIPAPDDLDDFLRPAEHAPLERFLLRQADTADVLIVSIDMLAYGSLLASRETGISQAEAVARVNRLRTLRREHPDLHILAMSVLMRSTISALSTESLPHYYAVTEYSKAAHRARSSGLAADAREAERIAQTIPPRVLDAYLSVRARNHAVNRQCVALAAEGVIDRLLLPQEDAQPLGLHRIEQATLLEDIAGSGAADRVWLHNGTDEGGCLCATFAAGWGLRLHLRLLGGDDGAFIARYEDRPFIENIRSQCAFAGITLTDADSADKVLCVLTPGDKPQREAADPLPDTPKQRAMDRALAAELRDWMAGPLPVGLLDVRYANGGALDFLGALSEIADPLALAAYAGWNTASNALGTVLAQLALQHGGPDVQAFTIERLLDDLLYQAQVRGRLQEALRAAGDDPLRLRDPQAAQPIAQALFDEAMAQSPVFAGYNLQASCRLPWPRTFEADIRLEKAHRR